MRRTGNIRIPKHDKDAAIKLQVDLSMSALGQVETFAGSATHVRSWG